MNNLLRYVSILMLAAGATGGAGAHNIPFRTGNQEDIVAAIDKAVESKPRSKAALDTLNADLAKALNNMQNPVRIRERAAWALGRLDGTAQASALVAAAKDKGLLVRSAALDSLMLLRPASALAAISTIAVSDPNPQMRYRATLGLGLLRQEKAIQTLVKLSSDPSEEIRGAATLAMTAFHSTKNDFSEVMKEMSQDPGDFVKPRAIAATHMIKRRSADLIAHLQSPHMDIRLFTASYFRFHGAAPHIAPLQAALKSEANEQARMELDRAIGGIRWRIKEAERKAKAKAEAERKMREAQTSTEPAKNN